MTQVFHFRPTGLACPAVRMLRILSTGSVKVAIGFLGAANHSNHGIHVGFQLLVWIGLKQVARTFNRLVGVGVVKRIPHHSVNLKHLRRIFQMFSSVAEVGVTVF